MNGQGGEVTFGYPTKPEIDEAGLEIESSDQNPEIPTEILNQHLTSEKLAEVTDIGWPAVMLEAIRKGEAATEDVYYWMNASRLLSKREKAEGRTSKEGPLIQIATTGCRWRGKDGGCTYCEYGANDREFTVEQFKGFIDDAIEIARRESKDWDFKEYNINPLGSMFDETEFPAEARRYLFEKVQEEASHLKPGELIFFDFESRYEFINEDVLKELRSIITDDRIVVEVGVGTESICEAVREGTGNKNIAPNWREKIELMKEYNIGVLGHVLVKHPFLTEREAVADVVGTMRYLEKNDLIDLFIVMTMNSRPGTLVSEMEEKGLYKLPSIWSVVEIMKHAGPELACKSKFLGFKNNVFNEDGYVHGCEGCSGSVVDAILHFNGTREDYDKIMDLAEHTDCTCKQEWKHRMLEKPKHSLAERTANGLDTVLRDHFGSSFVELQGMVGEGKSLTEVRAFLNGKARETIGTE